MKYLIVGLGNVGEDYKGTRHNIGFMVIRKLLQDFEVEAELKRHAFIANAKHRGKQLILAMPTTYMNLSGKAVRFHMTQNKIPLENILIITDDLALPFGQARMRGKGSDGGHNGLKHINEVLGTQKYARMKVGIGDDYPRGRQVDYVLAPFSEGEQAELPNIIEKCAQGVLDFISIGLDRTMNNFNRKE